MALLNFTNSLWLAATAIIGAATYFVIRLIMNRRFYRGLPGPPHDPLWGHLKIMGEYMKNLPPGAYLHHAITQIKQDYNLPDVFYFDLWPITSSIVFLTSPDAAAMATTVNTYPQAQIAIDYFKWDTGLNFIEATNGPLWKELHQQLGPSLTPAASKAYFPGIVKEATVLYGRLQQCCDPEQVIDIHEVVGRYPFQVAALVFFGERLSEQAYTDSKRMVELKTAANVTGALMNPLVKWKWHKNLRTCVRSLESEIEVRVRARYAELQLQKDLSSKAKSTCVLDRMLIAQAQTGNPLDSRTMSLVMDNAKGFIVAGWGTTTDTTTYLWMFLSVYPDILKRLREEHDRIFDKDFDKTVEMLRGNQNLLNSLDYTTAVINETLRLYPIGMSARQAPPNMTTFEYKGKSYPINKSHFFSILSHALHYDADIFEDPKRFLPDRFLGKDLPFPRGAYRPFERGLRACMGQSVAMDEMKIMLVMIARWFDFELVGHEPIEKPIFTHTDLEKTLGKHAYQVMGFTAAPAGPVRMSVKRVGVKV